MMLFRINADGSGKLPMGEMDDVVALAYSKARRSIYVATNGRVVDSVPSAGKPIFVCPRPDRPVAICSSPKGENIVVACNNWNVWTVHTRSEVIAPTIGGRGLETIRATCVPKSPTMPRPVGLCCVGSSVLMTAPAIGAIFELRDDSTVNVVSNPRRGFSVARRLQDSMMSSPAGICLGGDGMLYVCDTENAVVRKVDPDGMKCVKIYGLPTERLCCEGSASYARTIDPTMASDTKNGIVFLDCHSRWIRSIESDIVRTIYRSDGVITSIASGEDGIYFTESER